MPNTKRRPARLVLADGSVFDGFALGASSAGGGSAVAFGLGEVVFNTAMTGYQEALTDPSYEGQILVFTQPMIGNTGVNDRDGESDRVHVTGVVMREACRSHSNFRAESDLDSYLKAQGVPGIWGIDTRALTRRLRSAGVTNGLISHDADESVETLKARAAGAASMAGQNLVEAVGRSESESWSESLGDWSPADIEDRGDSADGPVVLALDCGAKTNILRNLVSRGCRVTLASHEISASEVVSMHERGEVQGLFLSNGPGDPSAVESTIEMLREVLAASPSMPVFGICLGHQMLAIALGAKTFKMAFGHRGANHPVLDCETGRVEITSQNHGFAVDAEALPAGMLATHTHLNDGTLAGFRLDGRPVFGVQHHPEASPGPHDAGYVFDRFVASMRGVTQSI